MMDNRDRQSWINWAPFGVAIIFAGLFCGFGCAHGSDISRSSRQRAEDAAGVRLKWVPGGKRDLIFPTETTDQQLSRAVEQLRHERVEYLDLSSTYITGESVDVIASLASLESVNVAFTDLSPDELITLAKKMRLRMLIVGNGQFSDEVAAMIARDISPTRLGGTFFNRNTARGGREPGG